MVQSPLVELLEQHGAATLDHPGGTLLAHLLRVADRLEQHTGDAVLAEAGLGHAIYGTDGFGVSLIDLSERDAIRALVGDEVEAAIYLYGSCDRSASWKGLAESGAIVDRWTHEVHRPAPDDLRRFADLSVINEVDVMEHSAELREQFAARLVGRFRSWEPILTPAVLADCIASLS